MALINCKECGKEMSENATVCPNCGNPNTLTKEEKQAEIEKRTKAENNASLFVIIGTILIIGLGIFLWNYFEVDKIIDEGIDAGYEMVDGYKQQKEADEQLKKDLYDILSDW